ncbi:MAG: pseudouridine synthase [Peptococcaceae bacterium]|nr:pseudouridine synthase [Peptococcaceae bacterium]
MERLHKVLAAAGVASRRKAEALILQGKVRVNGQVVSILGTQVDPAVDKISVEGKPVVPTERKSYFLLHKPAGYVTTLDDPQGRPKVTDLLTGVKHRVYPIGRLDYATEGLLLLTNDGDLAYRLTHPKYGVVKTYQALVLGIPDATALNTLRSGVRLEDGLTAPAEVRLINSKQGSALLELKIHEGRNRQVRRMCDAIGYPVQRLRRTGFGGLTLNGVPVGSFRTLSPAEVAALREQGGTQ